MSNWVDIREVKQLNKFVVEYFGHNGNILGINTIEAEDIEKAKKIVEKEIVGNSIIYVDSSEKAEHKINTVGVCTSAISKFYLG